MKQKHKNVNPQMAVAAAELNQALRTRFKASSIPNKKKRPHEPKKIKNFKPADGRFFFVLGDKRLMGEGGAVPLQRRM